MITDQSLKQLLSCKYEDLKKGDYEFLVENYFKTHSKEWYVENEDEPVLNLDQKEYIFWELIRRHAMPHGIKEQFFDFSGFIFPDFAGLFLMHKEIKTVGLDFDFWTKGEKMEFQYDVNFSSAKFLGVVNFKSVKFSGNIDFYSAKFLGDVNFHNAHFHKEVRFISTEFNAEVDFTEVQFSTEYRTIFRFCYKSENTRENSESSSWNYQIHFNFHRVELNNMVNFIGVHFHKTNFFRANIPKDLRFEECRWAGSRRLVLWKENKIFKLWNRKSSQFENYIERYRQIKLNYASFQEWELSGKAYRSEMYIRQWLAFFEIFNYKKPLMIPIRIIEFLMSSFYGIFSGYTQSITKPFIWLILSTALIFPFFYSECQLIELFNCNYYEILEISAKNTFPFYRLENGNFWIALIQKIFSSTLLAFFILALRKRYKQ
ncbi:MAG: pentapeptide repeat-containing protein [Bacteroidota bacterium]